MITVVRYVVVVAHDNNDFLSVHLLRHYIEATRNMQNYHRLFWASQERYDKLVSLSSSGGAADLKNVPKNTHHGAVFDSNDTIETVDSGIFMGKSYQSVNGSVENEATSKQTRIPSPTIPRRVKKELSPLKTEKGAKTTPEKLGKLKHDKSNDNFVVPKPPGPRKGARRPLNLDAIHKSGSTGALNGNNVSNISNTVPHSPVVTAPSSVDIAVTRRTQSRYTITGN